MKFSLLMEVQPDDASVAAERRSFAECMEQAQFADELGYHEIWAVEHHGLTEYSHCSAPEILLGFLAGRTRRIRLGHGVTLTPHRYNHPIRVAERIATLDILSNGRVDWGSGKSSSLVEQGAFEIDRAELEGQWMEALSMIPRMWRSDVFEWNGKYFHIPPTAIIPKPVQQPHPPIFAACSRPETVELAGRLGIGSLNFTAGTDEYLLRKVESYRKAISTARGLTNINNRFCCTPSALVLEDDRQACEYGFRGARFFQESLATYFFSRERVLGPLEVSREPLTSSQLAKAMKDRNGPGSSLSAVIGDPASAVETVARFQAAGVDELILVMQMATIPHELVMRSLRTFSEKVMPNFR
ncbi:MAG TPA: LLM class flavin-dependent oxidoreductase [Bryobacteraceae bacterium]|jgi:alkanesulfonate monooxygenase SsuD/methylene tetrahydromethanopterin reductase-like flavin-dependent oxidoreductase (luciferase family)|nr:LLM class flavin-dependent oxidoreductase [Bryobacteraceae bacterium]